MAETPEVQTLSVDDFNSILSDIRGFGITDAEEIVTMVVGGRKIQLRISNISNDDEVGALIRCDVVKGHAWVQRMRCEILARSITWINGADLSKIQYVVDPYSEDKEERPVRLVLVDILMKWGQEAVLTLWKIYMVHCQSIENSLIEQLPDSQLMTETEKRFLERVAEELQVIASTAITETADAITSPPVDEE